VNPWGNRKDVTKRSLAHPNIRIGELLPQPQKKIQYCSCAPFSSDCTFRVTHLPSQKEK